jgi:protein-S-isoprenylcysteine O-methyltransferase Ste14
MASNSGPYRIVQRPGYAGNILPLPGIVLALSLVWTLIPAVVTPIIAVKYKGSNRPFSNFFFI